MRASEFKKLIREEVRKVLKEAKESKKPEEIKKSLNENYRDNKENVAIMYAMLKKGGRDAKFIKDAIKDIKTELAITINPNDATATLKLANQVPELEEYLDSMIEDALDNGMGRVKGMYSMSGRVS